MINKNYKRGFTRYAAGFTLMETLVAVLVLSLSITGPLVIAQKGLQAALIAKDQVSAFELAQDAVESVRYARDSNCLTAGALAGGCPSGILPGSWLNNSSFLSTCVSADGSVACTMEIVDTQQPVVCPVGGCPPINYDASHNYYTYKTGSPSIFTRSIRITTPVCNVGATLCNPAEASVSITVQWSDPISHSITVKENILDWQ